MKYYATLLLFCALMTQGCTTQNAYTGNQQVSKATIGAGVGTIGGAVIGALTGSDAKERRKNALIGAGIGAVSGGGIGAYMDQQESALRSRLQNSGVSVTRVGNDIVLNMPGNITFATNESSIRANFYETLNSVAIVLKKFKKTAIIIEGHTDNTGSSSYNQALSEKRADSVRQYLIGQNISYHRLSAIGYGEQRPVASNQTTSGRAQNRRVEIRLQPLH